MKTRIIILLSLLIMQVFSNCNDILYCQTLQWRALPNSPIPPAQRFEDIDFINGSTGWVVQYSGKIFRTTNGGNSWDTMFTSPSGNFRSIGFFDSQNGILGTLHPDSNLVLFKTTNGGTNFTPITNIPAPRILGTCGINITNENVAYACGKYETPARIVKTTDKGNSWTSFIIDTSLVNSLVDCYFWSPDSGIAVGGYRTDLSGGGSAVILTTNGGNTWQRVYVSTRPDHEYCWKISFVNRKLGFVSIQSDAFAYFLKTTDGGSSWEAKPFRAYIEQGIGFVNENTGWIGGWGGPTYETTDAGNSWHLAGWGSVINRFRFLSDTLAYAVGNRVYKYSRQSVGIQIIPSMAPEKYSLSQNYPNPFNPVTHLEFGISLPGFVSLKVYDVLGNEVAALVNEKKSTGSYSVEFDGSNIPGGVYFYQINIQSDELAQDEFIETKKMLLIK